MSFSVALAGLGRIAHSYEDDPLIAGDMSYPTHLSVLREHPGFRLCAACDPSPVARGAFAAKPGGDIPLFADCGEMFATSRPDLLVIAASAGAHGELLRKAVHHGVRAVFCEKPLATSLAEAEDMARLAKRENMLVAVNYMRAFGAAYRELAARATGGEFGEILGVEGAYCRGVFNNGSHLLDLFARFCGSPDVLAGFPGRDFDPSAPDPALDMILKFPGGALGHLRGFRGRYGNESLDIFEMDILFSKARLEIRLDQALLLRALPSRRMSDYLEMETEGERFSVDVGGALYDAYDNLHACLQGNETPACCAQDALIPLRLINQALAQMRGGRNIHGETL
ncbi:MAG: hypothetical protein FD177_1412 [Desulfovibrionaceae bacterium]|nr:MAG: hypothetical protein FD177_1412 [Desulfovibrionaceae bacterium]